jgi:septal ring-binding cell division protein DamX
VDAPLTGRQWLAAQADEHLTLQIFAVNQLDRIEQLITSHPNLDVHVLATEGGAPRYRIFHGVFTDEASAREAYAAMPASITSASHGAIVKSFSAVREDLRTQAPTVAAAPTTTPAAARQTTAPGTDNAFTVQVFATSNRDNAKALMSAFPDLQLKLHEFPGGSAPWRVIYGRFGSAEDARTAASTLPQDFLARIGKPLPKSFGANGTLVSP